MSDHANGMKRQVLAGANVQALSFVDKYLRFSMNCPADGRLEALPKSAQSGNANTNDTQIP